MILSYVCAFDMIKAKFKYHILWSKVHLMFQKKKKFVKHDHIKEREFSEYGIGTKKNC